MKEDEDSPQMEEVLQCATIKSDRAHHDTHRYKYYNQFDKQNEIITLLASS